VENIVINVRAKSDYNKNSNKNNNNGRSHRGPGPTTTRTTRVAPNFGFGFGKSEIRPFFPNSAKFGFGQISGRIWQTPMQLQCVQLVA